MRHHIVLPVVLVGLLFPAALNARVDIRVEEGCVDRVSIKASDAKLSEVLSTLARELSFELSMSPEADGRITLDDTDTARRMIDRLTRQTSTTYMEGEDPNCEGLRRPHRLWVHPSPDHEGPGSGEIIRAGSVPAYDVDETRAEADGSPVVQRPQREHPRHPGGKRSQMSPEERYVDRIERRERRNAEDRRRR